MINDFNLLIILINAEAGTTSLVTVGIGLNCKH